MRPITHSGVVPGSKCSIPSPQQVHALLKHNRHVQEHLRRIKEVIIKRMHGLEQFISTYRLKIIRPPMTSILSYLKYERVLPHAYHQQSKAMLQQDALRTVKEEDFQFMSKLNPKANQKKSPNLRRVNLDVSKLSHKPRLVDFLEVASQSQFKSGLELFHAWSKCHIPKKPKSPYSSLQERVVIQKQRIYGGNWEKICQFVEDRTFDEIYYQFHNRLNPKIFRGRWTYRQNMMLIMLIEHYGERRWSEISLMMGEKGELQVRERYCNILMPTLSRIQWTSEQEDALLELAVEKEFCWKQIAKQPIFRGKTDNALWRKWRSRLSKMSVQQIEELVPDRTKTGMREKILKYREIYVNRKNKGNAPLREVKSREESSQQREKCEQNDVEVPKFEVKRERQREKKEIPVRVEKKEEMLNGIFYEE